MEEEDEIKIEYIETYEQDPLSLNYNLQEDVTVNECHKSPCKVEDSGENEVIIKDKQDNARENEENDFQELPTTAEKLSIIEDNQNENNSTNIKTIDQEKWYEGIDSIGRYLCKFCNLPYLTIQNVRRHALSKHPTEARKLKEKIARNNRSINKCHICKKKYKILTELQYHLKAKHSIGNSHFCHRCQALFDDKESLIDHLKLKHKLDGSNLYVCLTCGYKTHKVSHFNQHQKIHSQYKTHKCHYCSYATNNMPNLRIHERIHEKTNKPYKCKYKDCSYSSATHSALRIHEFKHSKEEHFIYCDKCTYKTVYKQSLKKHIDSHARNTVKTIL